MGQRFVACDREQSFLMPPDVREWLPEDHFSWFVLGAVGAMDLEAFYGVYRADGRSRRTLRAAHRAYRRRSDLLERPVGQVGQGGRVGKPDLSDLPDLLDLPDLPDLL